jgi:hypothetical protein
MSAPTIFTIHSSRHGEIVETHRISPFVAVVKARRLHGMARLHHGQNTTAFQAARFGQSFSNLSCPGMVSLVRLLSRKQLQSELPAAVVT